MKKSIFLPVLLLATLFCNGCRTPWIIDNCQPEKTRAMLHKQMLIVKLKTYPEKYAGDFGENFRLRMQTLLGKNQVVYSGDLLSMQDAFTKASKNDNKDKFNIRTREFVTLGKALGCSTVLCGVISIKENPELSVKVQLWWLDTSDGELLLTIRKDFDTANRYERKDFANYLKLRLITIKNQEAQRQIFIKYCAEKMAEKFKQTANLE
ncbi:hypothetical protein P0136_08850 [Lentisphaerota bacterium ZTH]|nr:hypothetical protein JYG24_00045 [Lentisphaerota bacterium]WET05471.1 hypothetical protein P0136_08850 [Lentisphaerota bacterium ZTH]